MLELPLPGSLDVCQDSWHQFALMHPMQPGLATACSGCSGLGQHQSAEECIPAPSQVGSLQGASAMGLEKSECNGSACWKEPVLLTLPMPTGPVAGPGKEGIPRSEC